MPVETQKIRVHGNPDEVYKNFVALINKDEKNRAIYMHPVDQLSDMFKEVEHYYIKAIQIGDKIRMNECAGKLAIISAEQVKFI